jgi:cyclic beta-1,2-glucan synthetase
MAQALAGDPEAAWRSFKGVSPAHRSRHPTHGAAYQLEPYVTAGDTYGAPPYAGRGGWSWYTGSAGWLYRAAVETLLGLQVRPGALALSPRLPAHWPAFELRLKVQQRDITVRWERDLHPARLLQPDLQVGWGEWVEFERLPASAVLLVCGGSPTMQPAALQPPALPQPA